MPPNGLSGLENFGNTCYMNSAIQCLSNVDKLRDYFITKKFVQDINKDKDELGLVKQWYHLVNGMWNANQNISPVSFRNEVRMLAFKQGINLNFVGNGQNDVQEFIQFLVTNMHNCLSRKVSMTITGKIVNDIDRKALDAMKSWKQFFKNDYSYFVDLFYGQHSSNIYDLNKNLLSTTYEPFCFLTLPIPSSVNNINIYNCLDLYTNFDKLDGDNKWLNEKTEEYIECYKRIQFWSCPKILIVVLKRFQNDGSKNSTLVEFPLKNLSLENYSIGYSRHKNKYNLIGISNHIGDLNSGHYFAYCKKGDGKWYNFNDTNVSEINEDDLVTKASYCLFYKKI